MRATDKGGFLRDSVRSGDGELADHAYLGARERRGGLRTALMSAHLDPTQADRALSMRQFAGFIDQTYPDRSRRQVEVIAGDLNWRRCDSAPPESPQPERLESVNCELSPFWPTITGKYGYRDAIFDRHGYSDRSLAKHFTMRQYNIKPNRIDYLFARGAVRAADTDLTNRSSRRTRTSSARRSTCRAGARRPPATTVRTSTPTTVTCGPWSASGRPPASE